jgi:hypothetical protein
MAPAPVILKGDSTLARKWRKLKKRCSSSTGDVLGGLTRSKSMAEHDKSGNPELDLDEGIDGILLNRGGDSSPSGILTLKEKLNQWNQDLWKRRNSQGESIAQWWHWHSSTSPAPQAKRSSIVRSSSLKSDLNKSLLTSSNDNDDDDDDEVFVTSNPIQNQMGQVKNAMIVSASNMNSNPYCTGSRALAKSRKERLKMEAAQWRAINNPTLTPKVSNTPPPSPPVSDSSSDATNNVSAVSSLCGHDEDSGYDGYCPGGAGKPKVNGVLSSSSEIEDSGQSQTTNTTTTSPLRLVFDNPPL